MAIPKTGLLIGLGVGLLALIGLGSKARDQSAQAATPSVLKLPQQLSTNPAEAVAQLVNVLGPPTSHFEGQKASSGRVYDAAIWRKTTATGPSVVMLVMGVAPALSLYAIVADSASPEGKVLVSVIPDDVARTDLQKFQHSL